MRILRRDQCQQELELLIATQLPVVLEVRFVGGSQTVEFLDDWFHGSGLSSAVVSIVRPSRSWRRLVKAGWAWSMGS